MEIVEREDGTFEIVDKFNPENNRESISLDQVDREAYHILLDAEDGK